MSQSYKKNPHTSFNSLKYQHHRCQICSLLSVIFPSLPLLGDANRVDVTLGCTESSCSLHESIIAHLSNQTNEQ